MSQRTGTGERQGYAHALAGLWTRLSRALAQLESVAASPEERLAEPETLELMPSLQYVLHTASEIAVGIQPPPGAEAVHAELAAALADARDSTAEVLEAVEAGGTSAALPLVLEWRGALFRVRLARLRLGTRQAAQRPAAAAAGRQVASPAIAIALILAGALAFTSGAMLGLWPIWLAGLALVAGGWACSRP